MGKKWEPEIAQEMDCLDVFEKGKKAGKSENDNKKKNPYIYYAQ